MDVLAIGGAVLGVVLAAKGHPAAGAVIYIGSLVGLPIGLVRRRRMARVLPFSFASHFIVMPVAIVVGVVARDRFPLVGLGCFAFWTYYYACIALAEKRVRYVPWGMPFSWRVADASERPAVYWSCVILCIALATLFAAALFAASAGWIPVRPGT